MKAKLSSLALPLSRGLVLALCFGLVMTLVLAACGGGNSPNGPSTSSDSSGGTSSAGSTNPDAIKINGFEATLEEKRVVIDGVVNATTADPIVRVTYSISGGTATLSWISYNGSPLTGPITFLPDETRRSFDLNDAKIDLRKEEIKCGVTYTVSVVAVTNSGQTASSGPGTFVKPDALCETGPSSGSQPSSSSSVANWVFEGPIDGQAYARVAYPIGSGSFTLLTDDDAIATNTVDQPDIQIVSGAIRGSVVPCKDDGTSAGENGDVHPGEPYSSRGYPCLGSNRATSTNLSQQGSDGDEGLQLKNYYLVYLNDGNVYLLFFTIGDGGSKTKYPLKYIYWRATEKP